MDIKTKRILFLMLPVVLICLLSGCRTRTNGGARGDSVSDGPAGLTEEALAGENVYDASPASQDSADTGNPEDTEPGSRTAENPEASQKEFDENAPAEIVQGTDRMLHEEGEGSGTPTESDEAEETVSHLNDLAEEPAMQTVTAQEAEQIGTSEDADAADSVFDYYSVLLQERAGSLYECQRANVYWETAGDQITIHKTSPEHELILNAGAYDVSARLLPENLQVDDGWVVRKNPGVIVKIVDGRVLGSSVYSVEAAESAYRNLVSRDGWETIDAVRNGRVLLLSSELTEAPYLQLAAMLMIAETANPALYEDVDPEEALKALSEEASGTIPAGTYYYSGKEK